MIGPSRSSTLFVHVADRGADIFELLDLCRSIQTHFVVRANQDRRVQMEEETLSHLLGLLSPVAVRLLQMRDLSRQAPDCPAAQMSEPEALTIVAAHAEQSP